MINATCPCFGHNKKYKIQEKYLYKSAIKTVQKIHFKADDT